MGIKVVIIGDLANAHNISPQGEKTSIGGAVYYASVGAARIIPSEVGVVASIGTDFSLGDLKRRKIDTRGVKVLDGKTAHFTAIEFPDNTRKVIADRGVADELNFASFPDEYFNAEYFHLATSLPQNYLRWIEFLRQHDKKLHISADAFEDFTEQFPKQTIEALQLSDMVFINERELQNLKKYAHLKFNQPMILKKGPRGATYHSPNLKISCAAPKVDIVDTSGAGDVLAGSFLAQRSVGIRIEDALQTSVNLASKCVEGFGVDHL